MIRIRECGSWRWYCGSAEILLPWFRGGEVTKEIAPIKQNSRRKVWFVTGSDGKNYFAKYEKQPFFSALLHDKTQQEFDAAALLEKEQIPCVHFAAYGKRGLTESLLVSEAVAGTVSVKEFFFRIASADQNKRQSFLSHLKDLLECLFHAGIRHGDFHAGNILADEKDGSLTLVDPGALRKEDRADEVELGHIVTDLQPELTDTEALLLLSVLTGEPQELLTQIRERLYLLIAGEWEKRRMQILSGNSKFSHTEERDGKIFHVVSTPWFSRGTLPEDLSGLAEQKMPEGEGEELILEMFRARLEGRPYPMPIVAYSRDDTGMITLFSVRN